MKTIILDIECDSLNPTKIWCIVTKDVDTNEVNTFFDPQGITRLSSCYNDLVVLLDRYDRIVGHNVIAFDLRVMHDLLGIHIPEHKVIDTLVLSKLRNYKEKNHSLESWGPYFSFPKQQFNEFHQYSDKMLKYCINDVELNSKLYHELKRFSEGDWYESCKLEHKMAHICEEMSSNGFKFDIEQARNLYKHVVGVIEELDKKILECFPPIRKITQLKTRSKIEWVPFNPGSPKQVVERLNEAGWEPTEKTKGHIECKDRKKLNEYYSKYGWKVSETNLATLPDDAPEGARLLVKRMLYDSRRSTLEEWFKAYNNKTGRIHGRFNHIGTWTHRMSHTNPNMGNIAAKKSIKYKTPELVAIAEDLGEKMRSLWIADKDSFLVGTDAEGIQLRVLAHYMDDTRFTEAVVNGRKEDQTDVHNLNKQALGEVCRTRDNAKTFIYAWLLGAGVGKISEILGCGIRLAAIAREQFLEFYPNLKQLKEQTIPSDVKRGYFIGLDGRKIKCYSEHLMLAGYLQTGEAVIMKKALEIWTNKLKTEYPEIEWKIVNFVHDEWQTVVYGSRENAELVGKVQSQAITEAGELLGCKCPMAGSYDIGDNWYETH